LIGLQVIGKLSETWLRNWTKWSYVPYTCFLRITSHCLAFRLWCGLEHFQGGGSHSFSGQPVPVFHHPHREGFLKSNLNLPSVCSEITHRDRRQLYTFLT